MATKPKFSIEKISGVAKESVVAYQAESKYVPSPYVMESLRRSEEDYKAGRVYTQEEVDKMLAQWLDPLTDDEIDEIFSK